MRDWKAKLDEKGLLIADGAWGTQLAQKGLAAGEPPEGWNLAQPERVLAVAGSYVEAGTDVILTNTFGGSRIKLAKAGLDGQTVEINRRGAELSREAASDDVLVFASVGPTGEFLQPLGTLTEAEIVECFAEQVAALLAGGADGVVIETMTDLGEATAALKAARDAGAGAAVVSMTFQKGARGFATMMGLTPEAAAVELTAAGADIIGANCGAGIEEMIEAVKLLRAATDKPIWAKPNAGLPELVAGRTVYRQTPEQMAGQLPALVEAGARIVGGCCGSGPDHIRALVAARADLPEA